jgi:hypothetical protein
MTDRGLQHLLEATAATTVYPSAPDLQGPVLARIVWTRPAPRALRPSLSPVALAIVLLLILGAALLVPPSREAIARFFGVQGSKIERLPAAVSGTPFPRPASLDTLATPVALSDVPQGAGFTPALPAGSDELLQPYVVRYRDQPVVILHYDRFDLWQTQQLPMLATFGKQVPQGGEVRDVKVGTYDARWVTGEHLVYYMFSSQSIQGSQRTVTRNTLIWRTPAAFYRLETDLGLNEALQIARTLP